MYIRADLWDSVADFVHVSLLLDFLQKTSGLVLTTGVHGLTVP